MPVVSLALAVAGGPCKSRSTSEPSAAGDEAARTRATAAKDALANALLSRVRAVAEKDGLPAAVQVFASEAEVIAARLGAEQGVAIGRTSFRLRNPGNVAPAWTKPHVEAIVGEAHRVAAMSRATLLSVSSKSSSKLDGDSSHWGRSTPPVAGSANETSAPPC